MPAEPSSSTTSSSSRSADVPSAKAKEEEIEKRFDIDPSTPGRKVTHKKVNSPYLAHQRWKEQQRLKEMSAAAAKKRKGGASSSPSEKGNAGEPASWFRFLFKWSLVSVLLAIAAGQFIAGDVFWGYRGKYVKPETYVRHAAPSSFKTFTTDELWQFNGVAEDKPIYLSILGNVYDVTPGRWVYGPKGSYSFFAGRDASRAYVTGCFQTHLTHDLRGLSLDEIGAIQEWKEFFDNHPKYRWIGKLDLKPIDKSTPIPAPCQDNVDSKKAEEVAGSTS